MNYGNTSVFAKQVNENIIFFARLEQNKNGNAYKNAYLAHTRKRQIQTRSQSKQTTRAEMPKSDPAP